MTTLTSNAHGVQSGDTISMEVEDKRWWRRAIYWVLRRGTPTRTEVWVVNQVTETTLDISLKGDSAEGGV